MTLVSVIVLWGFSSLLVSLKQKQSASYGEETPPPIEAGTNITHQEVQKGFELFDSNTWIKGEKELQILEMRALKGQLEKDLGRFHNIQSATVLLDLPPQRNFAISQEKRKASVILTLVPNTTLSSSTVKAIINHLSGAIRGLESHMVAISDTSGRIYKSFDPDSKGGTLLESSFLLEDHLYEKMELMLSRLVGKDHFHASVQALFDKERQQALSISMTLLIDSLNVQNQEQEKLTEEIERQLIAMGEGYGATCVPVIEWVNFEREPIKELEWQEPVNNQLRTIFSFILAGILLAAVLFFFRRLKRGKKKEETILRMMTRIDVNKLAASIQGEDPKTIALMLSYLEPTRAEQIIDALKSDLQEKVLYYLSEWENVRDH